MTTDELLSELRARLEDVGADDERLLAALHLADGIAVALPGIYERIRPEVVLDIVTDVGYRERIIDEQPSTEMADLLRSWTPLSPQRTFRDLLLLARVLAAWVDERGEAARHLVAAPTRLVGLDDRMYAPRACDR